MWITQQTGESFCQHEGGGRETVDELHHQWDKTGLQNKTIKNTGFIKRLFSEVIAQITLFYRHVKSFLDK